MAIRKSRIKRRSQQRENLRRSACDAQIWKNIYTEAERVPQRTQRRVDFKNQMLKKDANIVGAIHESPLQHKFNFS